MISLRLALKKGEGGIIRVGSTDRKAASNVEQAASLPILTQRSISGLYALRLTRTRREKSKGGK